jgi:hypothetical protein
MLHLDLEPGSPIVTNDAQHVASMRSIGPEYIVATSRQRSGMLYIPASAVGNVRHGMIWLNVASGRVASMGWDVPPRTNDMPHDSQ